MRVVWFNPTSTSILSPELRSDGKSFKWVQRRRSYSQLYTGTGCVTVFWVKPLSVIMSPKAVLSCRNSSTEFGCVEAASATPWTRSVCRSPEIRSERTNPSRMKVVFLPASNMTLMGTSFPSAFMASRRITPKTMVSDVALAECEVPVLSGTPRSVKGTGAPLAGPAL